MPKGYEDSVYCLNCSHIQTLGIAKLIQLLDGGKQRISERSSCQLCGSRDLAPVPVFLPKPTGTTINQERA